MLAAISAAALAATLLASGTGEARDLSLRTDGRFAPPTAFVPSNAVTYDQGLVPAGAYIQVFQRTADGGATVVGLRVHGFPAGHAYGVHVHQKPCGADPAAAGGHFQHVPGTDAAHVNPENEVWLDFTTDRDGDAKAVARHDWGFREGEAGSVVIHDVPGTHGARVGCFTVPFAWTAR